MIACPDEDTQILDQNQTFFENTNKTIDSDNTVVTNPLNIDSYTYTLDDIYSKHIVERMVNPGSVVEPKDKVCLLSNSKIKSGYELDGVECIVLGSALTRGDGNNNDIVKILICDIDDNNDVLITGVKYYISKAGKLSTDKSGKYYGTAITPYAVKKSDAFQDKYEIVTESKTLEVNKKYLITGDNITVQLPAGASAGDMLEIATENICIISQADSENIINYKNKYFTAKGLNGKIRLNERNAINLLYKGTGEYKSSTFSKITNPSVLPAGTGYSLSFSPSGQYLAIAHANTPFLIIYKINKLTDTFTKLSDPLILPAGNAKCVAWSPDESYLAVAHETTPFITIYSKSGDVFTKTANPSTLPAGNAAGCAFSPDGKYLAVTHAGSPFITIIYLILGKWNVIYNPTTLPVGTTGSGCAWSYDGRFLAVTHDQPPYLTIYRHIREDYSANDQFYKLPDPAILPSGACNKCSFSYDGNYLSVTDGSANCINIYKIVGETFIRLNNPRSIPSTIGMDTAYDYEGEYLLVTSLNSSPYYKLYKRYGDMLIVQTNVSTPPPGNGYGCAFSSKYFAITHANPPYASIYKRTANASAMWVVTQFETLYEQDKQYLFL
jgi:WD40 repeat protein